MTANLVQLTYLLLLLLFVCLFVVQISFIHQWMNVAFFPKQALKILLPYIN
jgi:uncharacterized membrane protein (DUF485 family)